MSEELKAKFTPKACQDDGEFQGTVTLKLPTFSERMAMLSEIGVDVDDGGDIKVSNTEMVKKMSEIIVNIKDNFVVVDLTCKEDGYKIQSYETLSAFPGAEAILTEIATLFISGFKLGKSLKLI